jgi:DNA-binding IclR family transcriptional regulator
MSDILETPTAAGVVRALSILECLDNARRGLNISEVSRRLAIPKSSTHVLMITMERLGYIRRCPNNRDFCLALKTYALGHRMSRSVAITEVARPHLEAFAAESNLCAHMAISDNGQGVFIEKVQPAGSPEFDTYIGRRMDLHCTALGKIILAHDTSEVVQQVLSKRVYARYTRNTVTTQAALRREVQRVRANGYALDNEEEELGSRCVAVPITDSAGRFLAALSTTGTLAQIVSEEIPALAARLHVTARAISDAMGAQAAEKTVDNQRPPGQLATSPGQR